MSVMLATSLGDIVIDLHTDRCPLTSKNFLKLCKIKYYNHCLFHSVQKDFIAQTGDPSGKGTGGDSIYKFLYGEQARFFSNEIHPDLKHSKVGTVAMASAGENLNASQFYITLREEMDYLDGKHTVFGEVAEGLDTLMRINEAFVDEKGRPYKNIRIKHTYVLDDPFEDPPQLAELIPENSPEQKPPEEGEEVRLEDDWVPMDEQQDPEELEKSMRKKEAHSRAVVLEMIGDIPEAEVKPPENVLFVCKLNPVTQEEDLEVIFSRFGKVVSADIIRDHKTGDSLCYAFIEFETQEACEAAYFKMDNVLIDDRRIHVDFSQSVSKLWNQYRRAGRKTPGDEGKGHGCFKCGELGHVAKDCPEDANNASKGAAPEKPKYVLKDINRQHGDGKKSYDMIFDEDMPVTGNRKSQHEDYRHEQSNELKRDVRGTDRGDKERRELDYLHREGGNRSHEKERDRESKEKRDIERYREGRERERSGVDGNRNRDRYGEQDKYREERESNRHWEDRKRDKSTDDGSKDNARYGGCLDRDKYKEERGSGRHWEDRERERFNDDGSRNRDRYGEQDKYREEKKNNKHQEDRKRDRSTDDGSKDRLRYGEHRDRDKYREEKESNRQWERERGQRDREYQEVEGDREKDTYITQREAETDRNKSDKEMLKSDRGTKRHIEEQKRATDRKDSRSERHREDRTSKGDREKDTHITQREAETDRDKSDKEMLKSDRETKRHREEQKRATDSKDSRSERHREDRTSKRHGEERRRGRSPEDRSYRRRS